MEFSKIYKKDKIKLNFSLENCRPNSTYRIEFSIIDSEDPDKTLITEEIKNKIINGKITFSKVFICEYDFTKIECFKLNLKRWSESKFLNMAIKEGYHLSLSSIVASKNSIFKTKARENTDDCETIIIEAENPNNALVPKNLNNSNFFDYLKAGIQFNSFIVIDFSGGKGHTSDLYNNQFLQAIQGFRETIFEFVKTFKVYGFGASLKNNDKNGFDNKNNYFNLSMEENAEITGFTNIKNKYIECLDKINFDEKGYLSPVFEIIRKDILEEYRLDTYNIIFLLINNKPRDEDCQKCIDSLIEICYLPISFVTILIGDKSEDEIKSIKYIFKNKGKSSKSFERMRNNASFFTMKSCNFNNDILKNKCLRDIPEQLTEFYKKNVTSPEDIKEKNLDRIRQSFRDFDIKYSLYEDDNSAPSIGENTKVNQQFKTQIINKDKNLYYIPNKEEIIDEKNLNMKKDKEKEYFNKPGYENFNNNIYNNNNNDNNYNNNINNEKRENPFKKKELVNKNKIEPENNINNQKQIINPFKKNKQENKTNRESANNNININIKVENPFKKKVFQNTINIEPENNINKKQISNPFKKNEFQNAINIEPENNINKKQISNPFKKNEQNNNINIDINNLNPSDEKKYKNTPNPDIQNKDLKINTNPYRQHNKENKQEDKKEEKKIESNEIKINNINNIHNNDYIINKNNNEKKYKNITPGELDNNTNNNININNNIFKSNPFKKKENDEKKYQNETPKPDSTYNSIEGKNILNPYKKKLIHVDENKSEEDKKYVNATPGKDSTNNKINIINPFQKKRAENNDNNFEKNEIRFNENEEQDHKQENKIGSHFKKKFNKDFSKLSTLSSNSRPGDFDYSND